MISTNLPSELDLLSNEFRVLVDSVCWGVEKSQFTAMLDSGQALSLDEDHLLRLALHHCVVPWLWAYTREFDIVSENFRVKLSERLRNEDVRNQLQDKEVAILSNRFAQQGISHLVFKGVSVTAHFYKCLINSRYSDDIDILVLPDDIDKAMKVITNEDYELRQPQDTYRLSKILGKHMNLYRWRDIGFKKRRNTSEKIDLHWRIADPFLFPVDTKDLLNTVEAISVGDVNVPALPFSILFVYVCVHGHTDYFFRLRNLVDIHCAMNQKEFNLTEIVETASRYGVEPAVRKSIAAAELIFRNHPSDSKYAQIVLNRYIQSNGLPGRSHPNKGVWTVSDKLQHVARQLEFRSENVPWFSPICARFKYNTSMLDSWPDTVSPAVWLPIALLTRFVKSFLRLANRS